MCDIVFYLGSDIRDFSVVEFLQHLKAHPTGRWIPVILIGGEATDWHQDEVVSAGAAALLRSPLQIDTLQRLFSASGDLLFRPFDDAPALSTSTR